MIGDRSEERYGTGWADIGLRKESNIEAGEDSLIFLLNGGVGTAVRVNTGPGFGGQFFIGYILMQRADWTSTTCSDDM